MTARFKEDTFNLEGLNRLTKALKIKNPPHIEVGIIEPNSRAGGKGKSPSNAMIGAAHEYGSPATGLPARSWLRMPIQDFLQKEMEANDLLSENALREVIKKGTIVPWLEQVKISAISVIKKAFSSNGFGRWVPWKPGYTNKTGQILVDSGQLRDSVDAKVVN